MSYFKAAAVKVGWITAAACATVFSFAYAPSDEEMSAWREAASEQREQCFWHYAAVEQGNQQNECDRHYDQFSACRPISIRENYLMLHRREDAGLWSPPCASPPKPNNEWIWIAGGLWIAVAFQLRPSRNKKPGETHTA